MSQRTAGNSSKYPSKYNAPSNASANATSSTTVPSASSNASNGFPLMFSVKLIVWCIGWWIAVRIEFGAVYVVCSAIYAIFTNLSHDESAKGKLSAYSVFNQGAKRIAGSMDAESFENEIRHKPREKKTIDLDLEDDGIEKKEHYARKSKAANQPCVCGSGKKYKNCCSLLRANEREQDAEWEAYEREWGAAR